MALGTGTITIQNLTFNSTTAQGGLGGIKGTAGGGSGGGGLSLNGSAGDGAAGSLNLNVRSKDQHFIRVETGLKVYFTKINLCYCFAPYLGLSWVGEFPLHASKEKATFINQECLMNVESYDSSVQLASPQAGIKWTCCDGASLILGYRGLFNNKTQINQVEGRFEWIF